MKVQITKTVVNSPGHGHAESLVSSGKVDKTSDWSFSAEDGNKLLGADGTDWGEYAKWFLGSNPGEPKDTKGHYSYPFGKNGKIYRSAVIAIKSRSAQQKEDAVYNIADQLLSKIDGGKRLPEQRQKAWSTLKIVSIKDATDDDEDETNFDDTQTGRSDEDYEQDDDAASGKDATEMMCAICGYMHDGAPEEYDHAFVPVDDTGSDDYDEDNDDTSDADERDEGKSVLDAVMEDYDEGKQRRHSTRVALTLEAFRRKYRLGFKRKYGVKKLRTKDAGGDAPAMVIEGIASTPTTDRVGDIMVADGAEFKLPMPFLWQHDMENPIGTVTLAKATADGIPVRIEIPDVKEPGILRDKLLYAMACLKYGLVKGLSIGFMPIEYSYMEDTGGYKFIRWNWYELSGVTIPANVEATIETIKALDMKRVNKGMKRPVVNLSKFRRADLAKTTKQLKHLPPPPAGEQMSHVAEATEMLHNRKLK